MHINTLTPMPQTGDWLQAINDWHRGLSELSNKFYPHPMDRQTTPYDPMHYFALLTHLQPPPGRVLDWLYVKGANGWPFLYWRNADAPAHTHVDQLDQEPGRRYNEDLQQAITAPVLTDGSPEGWMQLVLFRLKAGNTMLRWHAAYKSVTLICSQEELRSQVEWQSAGGHFMQNMGAATVQAALALDVTPTVDLSDPHIARVGVTRFTAWGGFYRQSWAMNRQGPHALRLEGEVQQVRYDCGVMF